MIKSAVMVFSKDAVNGCWKWGELSLPKVSSYSYLGIDFSSNGAWDMHIKKLLTLGAHAPEGYGSCPVCVSVCVCVCPQP